MVLFCSTGSQSEKMILQACSGHLMEPFFHLSQNVAVMKYIVQSLQWAVNVQVTLLLPWRAVCGFSAWASVCSSSGGWVSSLTLILQCIGSIWCHSRSEEGQYQVIRQGKSEDSLNPQCFLKCLCVCVFVYVYVRLKCTTHVIHIPLCLYFSMWLFVSHVRAWLCFTRAFLWKSECASSAMAREVKGRWTRWAVPMERSWTHRYPGRARGYVASIHETSLRSSKGRPATDWLSSSRPPLPLVWSVEPVCGAVVHLWQGHCSVCWKSVWTLVWWKAFVGQKRRDWPAPAIGTAPADHPCHHSLSLHSQVSCC